jgi:hypothetical protein
MHLAFTVSGIAAVAMTVGLVASTASGANSALNPIASSQPHARAMSHAKRHPAVMAATCTTNASPAFVAIASQGDVAGGTDSAVLGGEFNTACDGFSTVAGGTFNAIGKSNQVTGNSAFVGSGVANSAEGFDGFVGAGIYNDVPGTAAFVGSGGFEYFLQQQDNGNNDPVPGNVASAQDSFVGAGDLNQISASGYGSFIGAGGYAYAQTFATTAGNHISGTDSFIGAGDQNDITTTEAVVGGGASNVVSGAYGAILGGSANKVTAQYGSVLGGSGNYAEGNASTVAGGYHNLAAGQFSFAAGFGSYASTNGSFVWSDYSSGAKHLQATKVNQFLVRATGGVTFLSNAAESTGVTLAPGSGAWASASDRDLKRDVAKVDDGAVLEKVAALPVAEWSYLSERGVRHVGPMAQDFYAAFRVGADDRHITSIDEDGVALSAIKGLNDKLERKLQQKDTELQSLRDEVRRLEVAVAVLRKSR